MTPTPQMTAIDLSRADRRHSFRHDHPDIPDGAHALAVCDGRLMLGQFCRSMGRLTLRAAPISHDFNVDGRTGPHFQAVWLIENVEALETANPYPVDDATWIGMVPEEIELYEVEGALFDNGWYARPDCSYPRFDPAEREALEDIQEILPQPIGPYPSKARAAEAVCRKLGRLPAQARVQDRARQLAASHLEAS